MSATGTIRRVLQVHTRYRQAGGEDRAVEAERQLLEGAGIDVHQLLFDNAELRESRSPLADLRLAGQAVWSRGAARRVAAAIRYLRPDVVHVHNTFAAASPSIFRAIARLGVPIVQTLHNYRLVCPAATLFRDGHPCTDCLHVPLPVPAMVHACVRGSRSQSLVAVATIGLHRGIGTFSRTIDAFIALTEFQRRLLAGGGLPEARLHVVPNFLEPDPGAGTGERSGVLYVGRLSAEKGIEPLLLAAAAAPGRLEIAGDGPLAGAVREAAAAGHVRYLGALPADAVADRMRQAAAVVVPSLCYEGFPMVVLEAYAAGTPVIASRIGSLEEVVDDGITGRLVAPGDGAALGAAMVQATDAVAETVSLGVNARGRYEARYRGEAHLAGLLAAYGAASRRRG
jgi:glycosyltransferase involved in cell wall biosynthesis